MTISRSIIRQFKVPEKFGVSKTTLANWLNPKSKYYKPSMPAQINLGANSKGFYLDELEAFLEASKKVIPKDGQSTCRGKQ